MNNNEKTDENLEQTIRFIKEDRRNPWHKVLTSCFHFLELKIEKHVITMISDIYSDGEYSCNSVMIFGSKTIGIRSICVEK